MDRNGSYIWIGREDTYRSSCISKELEAIYRSIQVIYIDPISIA